MPSTKVGSLARSVLVKSINWACFVYTFMQVMSGQLSGRPLLNLAAGGLFYGLCLLAFDFSALKRKPRLQGHEAPSRGAS